MTSTKKSNLRLNDQLIPKPTDIKIGERMIQVAIPKEHPYSSHISCFSVFPSFRSPDDPQTGVRAARQASLNHLVPGRALQVRVSSKTMGAPYRQEILDFQRSSRNQGVVWPGEHGFLDHTKPVRAEGQVWYPTPPRTVLPNPKLRDVSLSERTANMLSNVERSHWISSYQLQHTGSGPANPLKMDDFNEKIFGCTTGGVTSHNAPLRERSQPTFVLSKPREGRMASRRYAHLGPKNTLTPGPTADGYEALNQRGSGKNEAGTFMYDESHTEANRAEKSSVHVAPAENTDKGPSKASWRRTLLSQEETDVLVQSGNKSDYNLENHPHIQTQSAFANKLASVVSLPGGERSRPAPQHKALVSILPRAQTPFNKQPVVHERTPFSQRLPALLELQESFSKSEAHRGFNGSITPALVNLRDNVAVGRKHNFHGINCYYYHG